MAAETLSLDRGRTRHCCVVPHLTRGRQAADGLAAPSSAEPKSKLNADPLLHSHSAAAHSQQQNHTSAVSDARKAIEIDPKFSKAYSRLGHALFSSGEYAQAVEAYEKGLEIDPSVRSVSF